ncbi:MAG: hypothetical protein ACI8X5_000123 [Planctomycetota bacterium]|jgi:hypothetical protein
MAGFLFGCRSQEDDRLRKEQDRLTMEMWREMIQQGTLTPVDSMEDAFSQFRPEMGATPEDYKLLNPDSLAKDLGSSDTVLEPKPLVTPSKPLESEESLVTVEPPPNYYQQFGYRIIVHGDTGLISKPFPIRSDSSEKMLKFIKSYGDFPIWDGEGLHTPESVHLEVLKDMDMEFLADNMRDPKESLGKSRSMGDWLMVTASPDILEEVEAFIDTFAGGPPQIEIEAKIVEWITRDTLDLGVNDVSVEFPAHTLFNSLGWNFPNSATSDTGGEFFAGISSIHDGVTYAAMFEALASYENVSIISRPKVATRDGVRAMLKATENIPYLKVTGINNSGNATTALDYQNVGVQLYVTPRLVGTSTIALQIDIEASQQTGSAVTLDIISGTDSRTVSTPILSSRSAETTVYLKPQQAVIIGGLISERVVEVESGIPILKDLPLLGYLFKSTRESTEHATLLFFIRPRLMEGTDLNQPF